jgi:hypothetical protein
VKIWKNTKLNIKCYVVCLWMELSYVRGSLIFHAKFGVMYNHLGSWKHKFVQERSSDQFFYNSSIMWSWFALIVMLCNVDNIYEVEITWNNVSILLYQLKSLGPKLDTNHEISSHKFSYFPPQWFIWHNFFFVSQASNLWLSLQKKFYKESNLKTFELALTFYEHVDLQVIPWKD